MKQKQQEPKIGDRRVAKCQHTFREVVQQYDEEGNWMCDHKETDEEDAEEVRKFKEQQKENQ